MENVSARMSTTPVQFQRTMRREEDTVMTTGLAGKVIPVSYIPILRGDSASGAFGIDFDLAEMPRPLLNAVQANVQAWFVPKSAFPQFSSRADFAAAYAGETIRALGSPDRTPPSLFNVLSSSSAITAAAGPIPRILGLHHDGISEWNTDVIDAFWLVYNFRLAAHSTKLTRAPYMAEDEAQAVQLPRAFWPSGVFSGMVPDYERALIVGGLDLDVLAGNIPVKGIGVVPFGSGYNSSQVGGAGDARESGGTDLLGRGVAEAIVVSSNSHGADTLRIAQDADLPGYPDIFAEMSGQSIGISLADLDKARETQAFAKLRAAMAGNDWSGFQADNLIASELMQGLEVPADLLERPMLLDSKRVTFGMTERAATDFGNLDKSVTTGRASATLSLNLPRSETGGVIIITAEVVPERLHERQSDEYMHVTTVDDLPDALRDVQRTEPVDIVLNRRIDARHASPGQAYGFEKMNDKWNRRRTRLGGEYYQDNPAAEWTEQRSAIWQTSVVDPIFSEDHWLCPEDFPDYVFSDTLADHFDIVARHDVVVSGLTQIGDVLVENNDDYAAIEDAQLVE